MSGKPDTKIIIGTEDETEDMERMRRRRERIRRMKKEKERRLRIQRIVSMVIPVAAVLLVCVFVVAIMVHSHSDKVQAEDDIAGIVKNTTNDVDTNSGINSDTNLETGMETGPKTSIETDSETGAETNTEDNTEEMTGASKMSPNGTGSTVSVNDKKYSAHTTNVTAAPPEEVDSKNVVFIDMESEEILAQRDSLSIINPASMTKVLTILVAAEQVKDLDDTFTMTIDITDYSYSNDCSSVGFAVGERVKVRDLFYGTILPSGGDAAVALAVYVAGSHEEFVKLMNEKAEALGLSSTAHFTNCVGLYDEKHH